MRLLTAPTRTLDEIESDLARVQAAESRLAAVKLGLLREADRAQASLVDGARSMADWAAARLDVSPETARTLVTTARGLESRSELEDALEAGVVSYERTVELCRAATAGVDVTDHRDHDIAGLRRVISRRRGRTRHDDREAFDARYLVIQPSLDRGVWRLHGQLPGTDGAMVESALDRKADEMTQRVPDRPPLSQRRADALVAVCGGDQVTPELVVFVDQNGATISGHLPVGPLVAEEAECLGDVRTVDVTDPDRRSKRRHNGDKIPKKVRWIVLHRDGGVCVVDGCTSRYRIQPHHLIHRADHGSNHPDNLVSLCWFHHHVVIHGQGRRLDPGSPPQRRRFLREPGRSPPD